MATKPVIMRGVDKLVDSNNVEISVSDVAVKTGLAATTDGDTALGWDGTKFKVVPAGGGGIPELTRDDSDPVYTDYTFG